MDFWIQLIGIIAMVLNVIAYQFKSKRNILLCMCIGSALFAVNMFMLGAIMGGMMNVLGVASLLGLCLLFPRWFVLTSSAKKIKTIRKYHNI